MNHFKFTLSNIQHIEKLEFEIDLTKNQLMCIVGKNGIGKTTLIRAISNFKSADTFSRTASPHIFKEESEIIYKIDNKSYDFKYNQKLKVVDTKDEMPDAIRNCIYVELPIPFGERFSHFQRLSKIDQQLRQKISIQDFARPSELINYLSNIYQTARYEMTKEVIIKNKKYYFILKTDNFYIREDYLSSGEYFLINLFKIIQSKHKLIVIDEIDISLDTSAQINLIAELRNFCTKFEVNIVFTTHSLALIKTLNDSELYYLDKEGSSIKPANKSYGYIKSLLFGFQGWDKYILTEDETLKHYLEILTNNLKHLPFFKFKIIYIGGATNVYSLMKRNETENFFSLPQNVICVFDGDQKEQGYCKNDPHVYFTPFESIEKELFKYHNLKLNDGIPQINIPSQSPDKATQAKALYKSLTKGRMSQTEIFDYLNKKEAEKVNLFIEKLVSFLNP